MKDFPHRRRIRQKSLFVSASSQSLTFSMALGKSVKYLAQGGAASPPGRTGSAGPARFTGPPGAIADRWMRGWGPARLLA